MFILAQVCPPVLNSPLNGALSYANDDQPIVFVLCNEQYDLPYQFDGVIFCLNTGNWTIDEVPDCTS